MAGINIALRNLMKASAALLPTLCLLFFKAVNAYFFAEAKAPKRSSSPQRGKQTRVKEVVAVGLTGKGGLQTILA